MPLRSGSTQVMSSIARRTVLSLSIMFATAGLVHAQELTLPIESAPAGTPLPPADAANSYAPSTPTVPLSQPQHTSVRLAAQLVEGGPEISRGMSWRIFNPEPGADGKLPLVATSQGGIGNFDLEPGSYLVHAAFGQAGATKRITVGKDGARENMILDAGGLKLNAVMSGGKKIPADKLRFAIYEDKPDPAGNRPLIVPDVKSGLVVRLNAGTYHVVSTYGSVNAVVRSDIQVDAGKLTEATVEHTAAQMTLKLVREAGGEALAETQWSVVNDSGDPISETVGPYATMVLAEGRYTVIAKNRDAIFQRDIVMESGKDKEFEVVADKASQIDPNEGAD